MRSVRCDVCGTKALMAASQCPKCSHPFEVRDGFGEMLPLAHCASCDSYYPQSIGSCKWCGTKPERAPIGPLVWKGFGVLTFVSLAIGAWLIKNDSPSPVPKPVRTFVADTQPTNQPKAESFGRKIVVQQDSFRAPDSSSSGAVADSTGVVASVVGATDTTQPGSTSVVPTEPVSMQSAGTVAQIDSTPAVADAPPADSPPSPVARVASPSPARERASRVVTPNKSPARVLARAPERSSPSSARPTVRPPARVIAKAPARVAAAPKVAPSKSGRGWVSSVARNWAVVRANPTRQSRILAAIGPNTRVQLGETRGEWRRIKTKGLAGWVEHRTLAVRTILPKRRLASRN